MTTQPPSSGAHEEGNPTASQAPSLTRPEIGSPNSASGSSADCSTPLARQCATLPAQELRFLIRQVRESMLKRIVGQDKAVSQLALIGALHVGAGLPCGARALVVGPTGSGKTSIIDALHDALAEYDLRWARVDAGDTTSPGWSGAPAIGDVIYSSLAGAHPNSSVARRTVVVVDEVHHIRVVPGLTGNMGQAKADVLASWLGLFGGGVLQIGGQAGCPAAWSSREALVIAVGAFTSLLDTRRYPTPEELVRLGFPLELATRLGEIVLVRSLGEEALVQLLRRWPELTALQVVCARLGYPTEITDEAFRLAARVVTLSRGTASARSAGAWLTAALREGLIQALGNPELRPIVVTPDALPIPFHATRRRDDEPPDDNGGWDATLVLTPRRQ